MSRVPEGNEIITTFELDTDGILHVSAMEKSTGLSKQISIDNAIGRFQEKEMAAAKEKISNLFGDQRRREFVDIKATSGSSAENERYGREKQLLEKASCMLENAAPEDQEDMIGLMEEIRDAMEAADNERLGRAVEELNEIIFYLES